MFIFKFLEHAACFSEYFMYISIKNVQIHTDTYVFSLPLFVIVNGSFCGRGLPLEGLYCSIVYLEQQSVCPIGGIGSPHAPPPPLASVSPPLVQGGGGDNNPLRVRGEGTSSDDWIESLALCILVLG